MKTDLGLQDSGNRSDLGGTGGLRDIQKGNGRFDLLPFEVIWRLAKHYEAGAGKYGDRNWENGIPAHSFVDSAMRHISKYMMGWDDEDHLIAAIWNLCGLAWTEEKHPELIDIPNRQKDHADNDILTWQHQFDRLYDIKTCDKCGRCKTINLVSDDGKVNTIRNYAGIYDDFCKNCVDKSNWIPMENDNEPTDPVIKDIFEMDPVEYRKKCLVLMYIDCMDKCIFAPAKSIKDDYIEEFGKSDWVRHYETEEQKRTLLSIYKDCIDRQYLSAAKRVKDEYVQKFGEADWINHHSDEAKK